MPAYPAHFSINLDDEEAGRAFYSAVFGWSYTDWGPPGFAQVDLDPAAARPMLGAIQGRRALLEVPTNGPEVTFAVDDVDAVVRAVREHGGRVLMEKATIPGVGDLVFFADPSDNIIGAMRYEGG